VLGQTLRLQVISDIFIGPSGQWVDLDEPKFLVPRDNRHGGPSRTVDSFDRAQPRRVALQRRLQGRHFAQFAAAIGPARGGVGLGTGFSCDNGEVPHVLNPFNERKRFWKVALGVQEKDWGLWLTQPNHVEERNVLKTAREQGVIAEMLEGPIENLPRRRTFESRVRLGNGRKQL